MNVQDWGVVLAVGMSAYSLYVSFRREREQSEVDLLQKRMWAIRQARFSRHALESIRHQMSMMANMDDQGSREQLFRAVFEEAGKSIADLQDILNELEKLDVNKRGVHGTRMMLEEAVGKLDILMEMSGHIVRQGEKVLEEIKEEKRRI